MPDDAELTDVDSLAVDAIQGLVSPPSLVITNLAGLDDERDHLLADPLDALDSVVQDVAEMVAHPADTAEAAAELAVGVAEDVAATVEDVATGAVDAVEWSVGAAEDAVEGAAWVATHPEQAISDVGETIVAAADFWTGGAASSVVEQVGEALEGVDDATGNVVSDTYETISEGAGDAAEAVGEAFADAGATLGSAFGTALGGVFGSETVGTGEDRTADSDSDGVTDWDERHVHGSDPGRWDTDEDGLGDGRELREYGTDPLDKDADRDGLDDGEELRRDTDPFSWDTDGDGWSDGMEARYTDTDPLRRDTDGDGLTDRDEGMVHRTDPNERDTDRDGLRDSQEIERGYDPNSGDTDGDGVGDGAEIAFDDGTWMDDRASALDAAGVSTLEAAGGVVLEQDAVIEHGTDPLDLDVAQPYALPDEADLTAGGHDPLPVAGTLDDARSSLAEPEPALPPSPIHDALTTSDGGISTEALPPNPIEEASASDPAGVPTLEAAGGIVLEQDAVVAHGTDPLDLDVSQPYALPDEGDLAVGGHDPLPVAGTLAGAGPSLAEPEQSVRSFENAPKPDDDPNVPNINDPNAWPTLQDAVLTTVDHAPTEMVRPSPIHEAVTTPDDGIIPTEALPPNPIHDADTSWEAVDALPEPLVGTDAHLDLAADLGEATPSFEPGALDTEIDFGG